MTVNFRDVATVDIRNWFRQSSLLTFVAYALLGIFLSAQLTRADPDFALSEKAFVGAWYSTRAETVIEINIDGTWHIPESNQTGWWALDTNQFVWMYYERDIESADDINMILSYNESEFTLQELDNTETTFSRVD
ncbi:MAG: hypothetical protein ABJH45_14195 [Paracoccaceae bacterium]